MNVEFARLRRARAIARVGLIVSVLGLAGCAGGPTSESTGEYIDDTVITTKVKAALTRELGTEGLAGVEVETYKGTVQLSGFVDDDAIRSRAGILAARIGGVQRVDNRLAVK